MPPKRRQSLGRYTPQAKRQRQQRRTNLDVEQNIPDTINTDNITNEDDNLPPALSYVPANVNEQCNVGGLNVVCQQCNATKFNKEAKAFCCGNGKFKLHKIPDLPEELYDLYHHNVTQSEHFLNNIRKYNCAFQMTSFGCSEVHISGWNPNFRIQGQLCHLIGSLAPINNEQPAFLQIYFMDGDAAIDSRMKITENLKRDVIQRLQHCLYANQGWARIESF